MTTVETRPGGAGSWASRARRLLAGHRAAGVAFLVTMILVGLAMIQPALRAHESSWRVVTFLDAARPGGAPATPAVEVGRAAVEAIAAAATRARAAGVVGLTAGQVGERTFASASPDAWRRVSIQSEGSSVAEAQRLGAAVRRAAGATDPDIVLTVRAVHVGRLTPGAAPILLAWVGVALGAAAVIALLVAYIVARRAGSPGLPPLRTGLVMCALILVTACLASPLSALRPSRFAFWLAACIVLGMLVARACRRPMLRGWAVPAASALVGLFGAYSLLLWAQGGRTDVGVTVGSTVETRIFPSQFAHPGHYAAVLALMLPFTLVGVQGARTHAVRAAYALALAAGLVALVLTYARAGWIAFALASLVALSSWRARATAVVAGLVLCVPFASKIADRLAGGDYGGDARLGIWSQTPAIIADHPVTGVGVRNFALHASPIDTAYSASKPPHAHNLLLNTAAELGVPAAAALLALLVLTLVGLVLALRRAADGPDRGVTRACLAAVVALIVAGTLDVAAYQRYTVVLTASVLGLAAAVVMSWEAATRAARGPRDGRGGGAATDEGIRASEDLAQAGHDRT